MSTRHGGDSHPRSTDVDLQQRSGDERPRASVALYQAQRDPYRDVDDVDDATGKSDDRGPVSVIGNDVLAAVASGPSVVTTSFGVIAASLELCYRERPGGYRPESR